MVDSTVDDVKIGELSLNKFVLFGYREVARGNL